MLLEPQPGGGAPPIDVIRRDVIDRLPDLPRYTQRLSSPHTGGLHWPSWEEDRRFRVERHVRVAGLPAPGGVDELMEWAGEYYSQRLDRSKPLWEIVILELADGRWALVTKTHHCMIDGVGSVDMATTLLDTQPERRAPRNGGLERTAARQPPATPDETPRRGLRHTASLIAKPYLFVGNAALRTAQAGLHAAESAVGMATHPSRARDAAHRSRALAELIVRDELDRGAGVQPQPADRRRAPARRAHRASSTSSRRSRTPSAAPSTTSSSRRPPAGSAGC